MVKVIYLTAEIIIERDRESLEIGFVPTMGNLHRGHLSLLEKALSEFKVVYFSIFVNPKQFGPNEDFNRYPRTLEEDIKLIESIHSKYKDSKIVIYAPINPAEVFSSSYTQTISVCGLSNVLEGKLRPGHLDGVSTVVHQLFQLIRPRKAYFGLKDFQQFHVIKQMVKDLALKVELAGMPIIREESGLALSSRNQYLSQDQKRSSLVLYQTISELKELMKGKRENIEIVNNRINELLKDKNWNYIEVRDTENFSSDLGSAKNVTILAVYQLGNTRLLDNMQVEVE
jgi:pantoate--beta-alanine ligase